MDARNHGDSPHTQQMSYSMMAADVVKLVQVCSEEFRVQNIHPYKYILSGRTKGLGFRNPVLR